MPTGKPGADSSSMVTQHIDGRTLIQLSEDLFGETPVLWGRYFKRFGNTDPGQYQHAREGALLRSKNIRVLPIARQTTRVDGTESQGQEDARGNVSAVIRTFGDSYLAREGGQFLLFLDVEGPPHSLSLRYWRGWARTVVEHSRSLTNNTVTLRSCVYAPQGEDVTWGAVADAAEADVPCDGVWIARWRRRGCHRLLEWDDAIVKPRVPLPCSVLLWQYADECHGGSGFDCNQANPNLELDWLLARLILPSSADDTERRTTLLQPEVVTTVSRTEDFASFVSSLNLRYFSAQELLIGTDRVRNGISNTFPPVELWHNIAPTLVVLDELRERLGAPIHLTSTYRNLEYNRQLEGAASRSQHLDFRALDFVCHDVPPGDVVDRVRELRGMRFTIPRAGLRFRQAHAPFDYEGLDIEESDGVTKFTWRGGIGEYNTFIHIDCRGSNTDW